MRLLLKVIVCLCLLPLILGATASATLVEYLSPRQLGAQSELVVRGRVQSSESYWNEKHTKIFTRTHIAVDQTYKGIAPSTVEVVQIGGIVGPIKVTVHGALRWRPGDEVLLFAEPVDASSYRVSGFSQGRFSIERNPETGEPFIRAPRSEGVQLLGAPSAQGAVGPEAQTSTYGIPLDEFVNQALGQSSTQGVAE